jgi:ethylmalonyl-CoA/methylmalonyl-CoA decarboxylase
MFRHSFIRHGSFFTGRSKITCLQRQSTLHKVAPTIRGAASAYSTAVDESIPKVTLDFCHDNSMAILTLCNPTRRNALTYNMMEQLDDHVTTLERWVQNGSFEYNDKKAFHNDSSDENDAMNNARALILTGAQGNFCSGLDLHDHTSSTSHPFQSGSQMNLHMAQLTNRIHSLHVPSIAAVDGNAIGGGAELTTCTDFVVLSRNARIQFVHVKRGASPGWGGGRRLVNKVGRRKALKMLLLGKSILGDQEAEQLSYADGVADEEEGALDATMRLIVQPILDLPCSKAIRAVKSVVSAADGDRDVLDVERKTMFYDTNKALAAEREAFLSVWGGDSNLKQIQQAKEKLREKKNSSESLKFR